MNSLVAVVADLKEIDEVDLTPLEWRTLLWSRCSLAALYGIRADDAMAGIPADFTVPAGDPLGN